MMNIETDALVMSDFHIGGGGCRAKELLKVLRGVKFRVCILNGDLIEVGNGLTNDELELLAYLREIRDRLVCTRGNHDPSSRDSIWRFIGVKPVDRFVWVANGRRICVMHGHQFDRICFVFNERWVDAAFAWLAHKTDNRVGWFTKAFTLIRNWVYEKYLFHVNRRAIRHARRHGFHLLVCGHVHTAVHVPPSGLRGRRAVEYLNCGCGNCATCSLVTVTKDGQAQLHLIQLDKIAQQVQDFG